MQEPPSPLNEAERQKALEASGLLSSGAEERFDRITRMASRLFSVPIALISLLDNDRQWFKSCQGLSVSETPRSVSFCGHTILEDRPLIIEDACKDERFADNPLVSGPPYIRFYAGVPLTDKNGNRLGTLCLIDKQPRTFSSEDQELLVDLGATVGAIIQADTAEISSRTEYQEALFQSERRARLVIEGTGVGTWQWNVQSGETIFNERWAQIVGYTLDELAPISIDTWMKLAHPDDLAELEALLQRHFAGHSRFYDCKARMRHKRGHWVWVHDRGQVLEWTETGEPLLMYGTHADITSEVHAEQALKASRDELASLVSNMPGVTYQCLPDDNWTMLYISKQVDTVSGYTAEDLINNKNVSYAQLIHPDDCRKVDSAVFSAIASDTQWHVEYRIRHRDGDWRWVEERGRTTTGSTKGTKVLEGFIVDITREHEAEQQLRKNHDALTLLNDIALDTRKGFSDRVGYALEVARDYLDMDLSILSEVQGDVYTVAEIRQAPGFDIVSGSQFSVANTWCQILLSSEERELFIASTDNGDFDTHPCAASFPLGAYMGVALEVEGRTHGTLNFSRKSSKLEGFDESELLFVRLLARWLTGVIERSRSDQRLNKLLEQLPGFIYQYRLFPDGHATFPFASSAIQEVYGVTPSQANEDAAPAFEAIHPEDIGRVSRSIERSALQLRDWQDSYRVVGKDNVYYWVSGRARPERLPDDSILWHGYIHDIDEQERSRQALERNEARLRSLFDFSPIGIALNDYKTGQFLDLNDALVRPTGYTREEFVQLSYWDVTPRSYQSQEEEALANLKSSGRYGPLEKEYVRKDGSRYPVRLQGMLSTDTDGRPVIWSLVEDITEQKRLDRMKNEFIATVSHELRTPLTAINGSIGLLAGGAAGQFSGKSQSLLGNAARNGRRLAQLINDLLDMEKLVSGRMAMTLTTERIGDVLNDAIDAVEHYRDEQGNTITKPEEWPDVDVHVDAVRLNQAFVNLLSNALKFSPEREAVEVSAAIFNDVVQVVIRDYGPGVAADFQSQLFKRFSQADASDSRRLPGTGLGLAITREICDQLGGAVGYRDAHGGGSEFYINLPIKE